MTKNRRMKFPPVKGERSVKEISEDSIDLIPTSQLEDLESTRSR